MNEIKTDSITAEQVFDVDVFIGKDNLFMGRGIPVLNDDLQRLKKWGINELYLNEGSSEVETDDIISGFEQLLEERATFSNIYDKCLGNITKNFNSFKNNNIINIGELREDVDEMVALVKKNANITLNVINQKGVTPDTHFYVRSLDVCALSLMMGISIGLGDDALKDLGLGALLYDIGMLKINQKIANKVGKFTVEEYKQMMVHTLLGYKLMKEKLRLEDRIALITAEHHERVDGKGYPRKRKGDQISPYARIVAIAQAFEGITKNPATHSNNKKTLHEGMQLILQDAGTKFDSAIVKAFLKAMSLYPVGSLVVLNNGFKAIVVASNPSVPMRPVIKVIFDNNNEFIEEGEIHNLVENKTLFIKGCETDNELIDKAMEAAFKVTAEEEEY